MNMTQRIKQFRYQKDRAYEKLNKQRAIIAANADSKILETMQEMVEVEKLGIHTISQIVKRIEKTTGRKFETSQFQTGVAINLPPVDKGGRYLRDWVADIAPAIRSGWKFSSPCDFIKWARPIFEEAWRK